jgi:hypothetical protein
VRHDQRTATVSGGDAVEVKVPADIGCCLATMRWRPSPSSHRHPWTAGCTKKGVNGNGVPMLQPNAANLPMRKECFGLYGDEQLWQIEDLGPPSFMPGSALPLGDNLLLSCARSAA